MLKNLRLGNLLLVSLLVLCGCSGALRLRGQQATREQGEPPLRVEVVRSLNRAGTLSVFVRLEALTAVQAARVNLTLVGLTEGEEKVHVKKNLGRELGESYVEVGKPVTVNFEVPVAGLGEYQVRAEWGVEPTIVIARSEIVEIKSWCNGEECFKRAKLTLTLSNDSESEYNVLYLAIGFSLKGDNAPNPVPPDFTTKTEDESVITLSDLKLVAGEQRPVEIEIDQDIPVISEFEIIPYARILSAN